MVDGVDIDALSGNATTHIDDNTQAHTDYLLNNANDSTSGDLTAANFITAGLVDGVDVALLSGNATTHIDDTTDPHSTVLTQTNIVSSGTISGNAVLTTGDFDASGNALFRNILIGAEETPPVASTVPQGTIYMKYTP